MSDDEFADASTATAAGGGGGGDRNGGGDSKRAPRFAWTAPYEATFFRSLCESVQLGMRENHTFKAEAWDRAAKALRDAHGASVSKNHLVNKADNARKKFRLWRGLREHPQFYYDHHTKMVTASDEAWKAHIEREPLSRALRGRPFEHEEFLEILYPDVVGSGGAPKRVMRPKRKGPDALPGSDDPDMPGTGVLDLQVDQVFRPPQQQSSVAPHPPRPSVTQVPIPMPGTTAHNVGVQQLRPTSTAIPPRTNLTGGSALTPPEETTQTRNRFLQKQPLPAASAAPKTTDPKHAAPMAQQPASMSPKRRRISGQTTSQAPNKAAKTKANSTAASIIPTAAVTDSAPSAGPSTALMTAGRQLVEEGLVGIVEALRARIPQRWPEQAMDIFFREFANEDMDLQLKIAEKVLCDENKATVFCKMPASLRKHWVKRLREVHNRSA